MHSSLRPSREVRYSIFPHPTSRTERCSTEVALLLEGKPTIRELDEDDDEGGASKKKKKKKSAPKAAEASSDKVKIKSRAKILTAPSRAVKSAMYVQSSDDEDDVQPVRQNPKSSSVSKGPGTKIVATLQGSESASSRPSQPSSNIKAASGSKTKNKKPSAPDGSNDHDKPPVEHPASSRPAPPGGPSTKASTDGPPKAVSSAAAAKAKHPKTIPPKTTPAMWELIALYSSSSSSDTDAESTAPRPDSTTTRAPSSTTKDKADGSKSANEGISRGDHDEAAGAKSPSPSPATRDASPPHNNDKDGVEGDGGSRSDADGRDSPINGESTLYAEVDACTHISPQCHPAKASWNPPTIKTSSCLRCRTVRCPLALCSQRSSHLHRCTRRRRREANGARHAGETVFLTCDRLSHFR